MYVWLTLILLLTSSSQATILNSTIDADAAEITSLNELLKASSPPVFHRSQSVVCEMINQCCSFIKPDLANYTGDPIMGSGNLMDACIGNYSHQNLLAKCPIVSRFVEIYRDKNFYKFILAIRTAMGKMQSINVNVPLRCSSDEAYAILCNGMNREKVESCERKRLIYVTQHRSDDNYRAFVAEIKKNLHLFTKQIRRAFPMVNITRTTASTITLPVKTSSLLPSSSTAQSTSLPLNSSQRTVFPLLHLLFVLVVYVI